jgi:lipoprotein NlpI
LGLGRYEASLPLFDQVIAGHPEIQEAQVYKGMALYLSGRPEEALEIEAFRREYTDRLQKELTSKSEAKT